MPNFRYRALTQGGEIVSGSISAPTAVEVVRQVEYLGLVPIDTVNERDGTAGLRFTLDFLSKPRAEDVTIFTRDLALLLKAGARLDAALDLLATDMDIGRLRPIVGKVRTSILGGESLAEALSHHPTVFPAMYVALVRVGEASGTLDHILELLANERQRSRSGPPQADRSYALSGLCLFRGLQRSAVFPVFRAAAICLGTARLQRQARSDRRDVSSVFLTWCAHRPTSSPRFWQSF